MEGFGIDSFDVKELVWKSMPDDQTFTASSQSPSTFCTVEEEEKEENEGLLPISNIKKEFLAETVDSTQTSSSFGDWVSPDSSVKDEPHDPMDERPYTGSEWDDSSVASHLVYNEDHTTSNTYMCFVCGKEFLSQSDMQAHSHAHGGESTEAEAEDSMDYTLMHGDLKLRHSENSELQNCFISGIESSSQEMLEAPIHENHTCKKNHICATCNRGFLEECNLKKHYTRHKNRSHKCLTCNRIFCTGFELAKHMDIHTGKTPYVCLVCSEGFASLSDVNMHLNNQKDDLPFKCEECKETFSTQLLLRRHAFVHTGRMPYICSVCDKGFWKLMDLVKHKRVHSSKEPLKCNECDQLFSTQQRLNWHCKTHNKDKNYNCRRCPERFSSLLDIQRHEVENPVQKCKMCGKECCGEENLKVHMNGHTCSECGKLFRCTSDLKGHEEGHSGKRPFMCFLCGKAYKTASLIKVHAQYHISKGEYLCTLCKTLYTNNQELENHSCPFLPQTTHTCFLCAESLSKANGIKMHIIRAHTCRKRDKCSHCGQGFLFAGSLDYHLKQHTIEQTHKCSLCEKSFCTARKLENHMDFHNGKTPHVCPVCSDTFPTISDLQNHHYSDVDKMPFACSKCGERFWVMSDLTGHSLSQCSTRYFYKCSWCLQGYLIQSKLKSRPNIKPGRPLHLCPPCCSVHRDHYSKEVAYIAQSERDKAKASP